MLLIFLLIAMWFSDRAEDTQSLVFYILSAILFIVLEFVIRSERVWFDRQGLVFIRRGHRALINYNEISSVLLQQSFLQSFLGYGSIIVKKRNGEMVHLRFFENIRKLKNVLGK